MKVYYAHFVGIYDTKQEERDLNTIKTIFPNAEIINPNNDKHNKGYKQYGMNYFEILIEECDVLVFRGCINNKISTGVYQEINMAKEHYIPVVELPTMLNREMSVQETRQMLIELGIRSE